MARVELLAHVTLLRQALARDDLVDGWRTSQLGVFEKKKTDNATGERQGKRAGSRTGKNLLEGQVDVSGFEGRGLDKRQAVLGYGFIC